MKRSCLALLCMASASHAAIKNATVFSEPSGYGQQYSYIVLEYDELLNAETKPRPDQFSVENHQIQETRLGQCIDQRKICRSHELILMLDRSQPDDRFLKVTMQSGAKSRPIERQPIFKIEQKETIRGDFTGKHNDVEIPAQTIETTYVTHLVAEQFIQHEYSDPSGETIKYNLFTPEKMAEKKRYPLVIFLHDKASVNENVRNVLWQGNGATVWASPEFQQQYPTFILAPQFNQLIIKDNADGSIMIEPSMNLIKSLISEYAIDENRIYLIGQNEGATISYEMNIKYPNFFAATYTVADSRISDKMVSIARTKQFILVSEEHDKTFIEQNHLLENLALNGGQVQKALLSNDKINVEKINQEAKTLLSRDGNIYHLMVKSQTLSVPTSGKNTHIDIGKIAYNIPAITQWIFEQHR